MTSVETTTVVAVTSSRHWSISATFVLTFLSTVLGDTGSIPSFTVDPQSAVVRPGSTLMLSCSARPEAATLRWMVNGSAVASQRTRGVEVRDGVLHIQSFNQPEDVSHEGIYQCLASTPAGSIVSREAKLEMATMRPFDGVRAVTEVNFVEGNVAVIPCSAPFSRPKAVIEFELNGTRLPFSPHHVILPSGSLQIPNVSRSDDGVFQCTAYNPVTGTRFRSPISHRLRVQNVMGKLVPPTFSWTSPETVAVNRGSDLTLECAAEGVPAPQVTWEKYGGRLPVGRFTQVLGNLVIVSVQKIDSGTYLCRANNGLGPTPTKVISVDIHEAPTIEVGPSHQVAPETSSVTFKCRANGSPKVAVQWIFNGVPLVNGPTVAVRDSSLTLSHIQRRQSGMYQCIARNPLGMASAAASLVVTDALGGGGPGAESRTEAGSNGIAATNTSPSLDQTDDDYDYDEDDEDSNSEKVNHHSGKLSNGVVAEEEEEEEERKSSKGDKVKLELPSPLKPEISRLSATSVLVQWGIPPVQSTTGPTVSMFKIQYKEVSEESRVSDWTFVNDDISYALRMFEVSNLKPGRTYRFRVIAVYSNQESNRSPSSVKFTLQEGQLQSGPIAAPIIVEARPLSTSEMFIGWQQQELNSEEIGGFYIFYSPFGEEYTVRKMVIPGARVRHAVLSHLQPGTVYSIRMKSYSVSSLESGFSNTVAKNTLVYSNDPIPANGQLGAIRPLLSNTNANVSPPEEEKSIRSRNPSTGVEGGVSASEGGVRQENRDDGQLSLVVMVIGAVVVVVVVVIFAFCFICIWKKRQKQTTCIASENKCQHVTGGESVESPVLLRNLTLEGQQDANKCQIRLNKYIYKVPSTHVPGCQGQCQSANLTATNDPTAADTLPDLERNRLLQPSSCDLPQSNESLMAFGPHSAKSQHSNGSYANSESAIQREMEPAKKAPITKATAPGFHLPWFQVPPSAVPNAPPVHMETPGDHGRNHHHHHHLPIQLLPASEPDKSKRFEGSGFDEVSDHQHLPHQHLHHPRLPLSDSESHRTQATRQLAPPSDGLRPYGVVLTEPAYKTIEEIKRDKEMNRSLRAYDSSDYSIGDSLNSLAVGFSTVNDDSYGSIDEYPGQMPPVVASAFARYSQPSSDSTHGSPRSTQAPMANPCEAFANYANVEDLRSDSWKQLASQISVGSYNVRAPNQTSSDNRQVLPQRIL